MYILSNDFFSNVWGVVRSFLLFIDSVGLTFIDDAYDLLIAASAGFDETAIKAIVNNVTKNVYIIIGIFALFRIAIILINTIINPDKLTDKESGFGNVLTRFVITIALFVAVPFAFDLSREVQAEIMNGSYIPKAIIGGDLSSKGNPGDVLKDTAIRSLIHPDERVATQKSTTEWECIKDEDPCSTAVESWNNDAGISTLTTFIGEFEKKGDDTVYIYNYIPIVTLLVGGFITYVLFSFAIDIAIRSVELLALEVLSPLFIVTYIDPKSSSSGPFSKWLKTCSKTFVSLFIKIGIVCLMMLFIQNLNTLMGSMSSDGSSLLKLLMMIAILIFAKKAPKWIGDMLGVEGGIGGLGIGKKLGEAALIGGAIGKGMETGKKFAGQKGKNFVANRLRNGAASIGAKKEAHAQNKANKRAYRNDEISKEMYKANKQSLWRQGRAAASGSRRDNWGKDSQGLIKEISSGYMSGRKNVNEEAQTFNEKMQLKAETKADKLNAKAGNSAAARAKAIEIAANNKEARKLYGDVKTQADGDRAKINGVYLNPRGAKEMNQAFNTPISENSAYEAFGKNLAESKGYEVDATGKVIDKTSGKVISNSVAEYGASNMTYKGRLAVKQLVADNVQKDFANYENSMNQRAVYATAYTEESAKLQTVRGNLAQNDVNYKNALSEYNKIISTIESLKDSEEYKNLSLKSETGTLNSDELKTYKGYNEKFTEFSNDAKTLKETISRIEEENGVVQIEANIAKSKEQLDAWNAEVKNYENKFKNTSAIVFDDEGKIKTNDDGSVTTENPYTVKVNGEKLNPVKNITRIEDIKNAYSMNASKAKSKYEEAMKDNSE